MYLFDASAIITLIRRLGGDAPSILRGGHTLILAFYEMGNFIWKEWRLRGTINHQEALELIEAFTTTLNLMVISHPDIEDLEKICKGAMEWNLTFYDAAYLHNALSQDLTLVTADEELYEKAKESGVTALSIEELLSRLKP